MRKFRIFILSIALESIALLQIVDAQDALCDSFAPRASFCSSTVPLPQNWHGHVFSLSQNYPDVIPPDLQPWRQFDPVQQPAQYASAVLGYFYEGNLHPGESSFDPRLSQRRGWYNAPWQDFGPNGREPIHGLTRERVSQPGELSSTQSHAWNNYAVGFYNAAGAAAIGRVWADHTHPNPNFASMPNSSVAAKLLFTTATPAEVPYLQGAPIWSAYVYSNPNDPAPPVGSPREIIPVRLLQIDFAVKDPRNYNKSGWIFGTFVYGGGPGGPAGSGWLNVRPVGLMWGNDPGHSGTGPLSETWINPDVHMPHLGLQGRLNGPVDNRNSSCLSCHSTAEFPAGSPLVSPAGVNPALWLRDIPSGVPFDVGHTPLDYSLQLTVGITNFFASRQHVDLLGEARQIGKPPRDGGPLK